MINQQWPWFVFREILFEMYLDLDKWLWVDLPRKNWHPNLQLLWGGSVWLLDFKATKLLLMSHVRARNTMVCEHLLLPLLFPLSHFLQCHLKYTLVFFESEVLAIRKPRTAIHKSNSNVERWAVRQLSTQGKAQLFEACKNQTVYKSSIKSSINFSIAFDFFRSTVRRIILSFFEHWLITLYKLSVWNPENHCRYSGEKSIAFLIALIKAVEILYI